MKIEDFVIAAAYDGDVFLICPDPAGTCPQGEAEAGGTLGSAIDAARDHIQRLHPARAPRNSVTA